MKVGVIGLGLIGASIVRAHLASHSDDEICGFDRDPDAAAYVQSEGWARVAASAAQAVDGCDVVILATPVTAYTQVLTECVGAFAGNAVLLDVGSMKQAAVRAVAPFLSKGIAFVPSHPIAGLERHGPRHSSPTLFQDRWCVITPDEVGPQAIERAISFWEGLGMRVATLTADQHDRVLGFTSHLPHLISFGMAGAGVAMERALGSDLLRLSAGSFRDFTRIARSNPELWTDILLANAGHLSEAYALLKAEIEPVLAALNAGDRETAKQLLTTQHRDFKDRVAPELDRRDEIL